MESSASLTVERRYRAFISYSHRDATWARWLQRSLESFRIPKSLQTEQTATGLRPDRLLPVFRDREDLASSSDLSASVRDALERSENLIVLCSSAAAASPWVNREIAEFRRLGRAQRIFCLVIEPDPALPAVECMPAAIFAGEADEEPGSGSEPMAADARPGGDGWRLARLKLIAGLLDVELDVLRQRDSQRRFRQLALVAAGSTGIALMTIVLAVTALLARNEAEQRRAQAEGLLGYLVGDLRRSLQPIGRLDLLRGVGDQALDYFATVDVEALSDAELLRQAEVMVQVGEIRVEEFQYEEAAKAFTQAYERSAALENNDPSDGSRLFQRAQAEFWLGFVAWRSGNLDDARAWLTTYRDSAIALSAMDPGRRDWVHEVAYGHHNLAAVDSEAGNLEEAIDGFVREIGILEELLTEQTDNTLIRDRADAQSWLGTLHLRRGDLESALRFFEMSTQGLREALANRPDDRNLQDDVAFSLLLVTEASLYLGRAETVRNMQLEAEAIFDELVAHDPENFNWLRGRLKASISSGWLAVSEGAWEIAKVQALDAVRGLEALVNAGTAGLSVRDLLARARVLLALCWIQVGEMELALGSLAASESALAGIDASTRINDERLGIQAIIMLASGDIHRVQGDAAQARSAWLRGIALLEPRIATSRSPFLLDPWARLSHRAGRDAAALFARETLNETGYRPLWPWDF